MYLIVIAWLYVTVMMALAEAFGPQGSVLGAMVTLVLYGLLPVGLIIYIFGTPERKRKLKAQREAEQRAYDQAQAAKASALPDAGSHAAGAAQNSSIAPVRKEP